MSDNFIRLVPTDVNWQPTAQDAAATTTYVAELFAGANDSADEVAHEFYSTARLIDSGVNTSRATCPSCGEDIALDWVFGVVDERQNDLTRLDARVPCCGIVTSLNQLDYDWPIGFGRFEITVLNGTRNRYELDAAELDHVASLLGHPVRQVLAHY